MLFIFCFLLLIISFLLTSISITRKVILFTVPLFFIAVQPVTAQIDTNRLRNNRVLNPDISFRNNNLTNTPQQDSSAFTYRIKLKPDRTDVQVGEELALLAEINFDDVPVQFNFYWNKNLLNAYSEGNVLNIAEIRKTGRIQVNVVATLLLDPNNTITDSIYINVDSIALDANPKIVPISENVTFKIPFRSKATNIRYRFYFGNDLTESEWDNKPGIQFQYLKPGRYNAYAEVGMFDGNTPYTIYRTKSVRIIVNENIDIKLSADKTEANAGDKIYFSSITSANRRGYTYRYRIENTVYETSDPKKTVAHLFSGTGNYKAYVQLISANGKVLAESSLLITINSSSPFPEWLIYVLIVAGIISGGSLLKKWVFRPKISFHPVIDPGNQKLSGNNNLTVNIEIRINPDSPSAQYSISKTKNNFIKKIKRN